jgi:hypothetical protein
MARREERKHQRGARAHDKGGHLTMAKKRSAKSGKSQVTRTRRVGSLRPKADRSVQGGRIFTKHPAKVTTPDIKL